MRAEINKKEGVVSIVPETVEDLWHTYKLITPGAVVKSHSTRKYKPPGSNREERISVSVALEVEKCELHKDSGRLRATGKIIEIRPEDIAPVGAHHTVEIGIGEQVRIIKAWKEFELDMLRNAVKASKRSLVSIVLVDYENALFASLKQYGVEFGLELHNTAAKKDKNIDTGKFFSEIASEMEKIEGTIILGGPGFAKENLYAYLKNEKPAIARRVKVVAASNSERSGVYELLKSDEMHRIMEEEQMHTVFRDIERFLGSVGRGDGLAAYGKDELIKAAECGAIGVLVILDTSLWGDESYERLLELVKERGGEIRIVPAESQAAEQVKAFGGAIALLRYKMQ
ncbi:MAG: mRNA surveillance protein pelota [Candidatus Micrarchaeota archaeon]|nr:mRNA surveillance protein pelota [Candidatus Micrarchaeota archaeon]